MTSPEEKQLLYMLASQYYQGKGLIVDAGLYLGASTNALAHGIKANPTAWETVKKNRLRPIHAYDLARWDAAVYDKHWSNPVSVSQKMGKSYSDGDDYSDLLRALLKQHEGLIEYFFGDMAALARVPAGKNVEIAFYDCLKEHYVDWAAFKVFGPAYVPGETVVVHQDYFYEALPYIKLRQEYLSDHFEYLGAIATTAVFRLKSPLPAELFERDFLEDLSVAESIELLERAAARAPFSEFKGYSEICVVNYMFSAGMPDAARERLARVERDYRIMPHRRLAATIENAKKLFDGQLKLTSNFGYQ
ncbi:hypothetical protein CAL15_08080 [Bordetella genomosp. 13]|uniref:Uncharacterized protein n=2 Tax=Bordetella genomosp. 13 TaxID=463040 RepID=A0A1W6ZAC8_9BORD|nr:hypothetical protein CAL15_08080 [Bordetella genomosp. 13]